VAPGRVASVTGRQVPLVHVPPKQLCPQAPQLAPSLERFAQAFAQTLCPLVQVVQTPLTQASPERHWLLLLQLLRQEVAPQMNWPQPCVTAGGQFPAPSQPAASVCDPPEQLADRQLIEEVGKTQEADDPLQALTQTPVPMQEPCPLRGAPEIVAQVPGVWPPVLSSHPWQVPLQALLQQTPSTQEPPVH
jgi:hypothetical protein